MDFSGVTSQLMCNDIPSRYLPLCLFKICTSWPSKVTNILGIVQWIIQRSHSWWVLCLEGDGISRFKLCLRSNRGLKQPKVINSISLYTSSGLYGVKKIKSHRDRFNICLGIYLVRKKIEKDFFLEKKSGRAL